MKKWHARYDPYSELSLISNNFDDDTVSVYSEDTKQVCDALNAYEAFGEWTPQKAAELYGRRRSKWTRVEALAYMAGLHDGEALGAFAQYLSERPTDWQARIAAASAAFDADGKP